MTNKIRPFFAAVLLVLLLHLTGRAQDAPQVIVLHNGNIVQGRLERIDAGWNVTNGPWYSIHVPARDVDFVAADLREAYRVKLTRVRPGDFEEHLRLAQWCLRHDLDGSAADRLLHLARLSPQHPAVDALEQQLRRRANPTPTPPSTVVPARFEQAVSESTKAPENELPPLPPEAIGEFTRSVQPLLLNRCGQATCHGSAASNDLQLIGSRRRILRKDLTWRNMRAVLTYVDPDNVEASPLLEHAFTSHGNRAQAPLEAHEVRPRQTLLNWVSLVSSAGSAGNANSGRSPNWASTQPPSSATLGVASSEVVRAAAHEPLPSLSDQPAADPFDPAEFNARFGPVIESTEDPR